jgi:hypothetical protein
MYPVVASWCSGRYEQHLCCGILNLCWVHVPCCTLLFCNKGQCNIYDFLFGSHLVLLLVVPIWFLFGSTFGSSGSYLVLVVPNLAFSGSYLVPILVSIWLLFGPTFSGSYRIYFLQFFFTYIQD